MNDIGARTPTDASTSGTGQASATTDARWRLVLGHYAENRLGPPAGETDQRIDAALEFLYGRLHQGRGARPSPGVDGSGDTGGERSASLDASQLTVLEWLDELRDLFPEEVCRVVESEAIDRFGLRELLTDPAALDRLEPDHELLRSLLSVRRHLPPAALAPLRRIVATVVDDLTRRLETELRPALTGRTDPTRRRRHPTSAAFDPIGTIEANLGTWDPERRRLLVEELRFLDRRTVRHPWDVIVGVDQSGSMVDSVINTAVLTGILAALPFVRLRLVVFDTAVVDLSHLAHDPVEILMSVQLGGGTDIAQALRYCEQLVDNPTRTVVVLITDFHEGGSRADLVATTRRLAEARVTQLGLAALDARSQPAHDRRMAGMLADAGMEIAALTPGHFAAWLAEKIR